MQVIYLRRVTDIDPEGPTHVYLQLAWILKERIESGELPPHKRIPTETALVEMYGVARTTVRRTMAVLREEGYVYTVPQRGSFASGSTDVDG